MYHFNENNIVTGYIKEFLHNFELPICPVFINGKTEVYSNTNYIYNHSVVFTNDNIPDNTYSLNNNYKIVQSYVFGQPILNLTKRLKLNSILYDTYTHEYLGDYLRFYRDYTGIDLMMLYNCFSNRMAENFEYYDTSDSDNKSVFRASDTNYKIYLVPIKFDKKYLIGIDSDVKVEMVCGLVDGNVQVTSINTDNLYYHSYKSFNSMSFHQPIIYDTSFNGYGLDADLRGMETCLKLCIKLPAVNRSSISIIEVSQPSEFFTQTVDGNIAEMVPNLLDVEDIEEIEYPSKLSLFKVNDGVSYPFADRLLEYLFGQAITSDETIGDNIERVRVQLSSSQQAEKNGVRLGVRSPVGYRGVWNPYMRVLCYLASIFPHTTEETTFVQKTNDLTYYIDKDIESLINVVVE